MSREPRAAATARLLVEARALSGDFDRLSQAVAEAVGLSSSELLAMDVISRSGPVTAGRLAQELRLTTGAITGLVDRLERAGFARRTDDPGDRRRVLVQATPDEQRVAELYRPLARGLQQALKRYSDQDLESINGFLRRFRELVAETAEMIKR
jgi:DNA-binding MarR family transcriptional regulator